MITAGWARVRRIDAERFGDVFAASRALVVGCLIDFSVGHCRPGILLPATAATSSAAPRTSARRGPLRRRGTPRSAGRCRVKLRAWAADEYARDILQVLRCFGSLATHLLVAHAEQLAPGHHGAVRCMVGYAGRAGYMQYNGNGDIVLMEWVNDLFPELYRAVGT